jgi:hypothetical protein
MQQQDYIRDLISFSRLAGSDPNISFYSGDCVPCLEESETQVTYNHRYLLHVGWAARILATTRPEEHIDIGSCSYFVSIVSAFLNLKNYDIRPMDIPLPGIVTGTADLCGLPFNNKELKSISCMHALEHVGLGRYGDPINPYGDVKAARELSRVLSDNGNLLVVLPIGQPKIAFNAHRIYSFQYVVDSLFSNLVLKEFSFIPTDLPYRFVKNADPASTASEVEGAGCFWFTKHACADIGLSTH